MAYDVNDAWQQRQAEIEREREQLKLEQQLKIKKMIIKQMKQVVTFRADHPNPVGVILAKTADSGLVRK